MTSTMFVLVVAFALPGAVVGTCKNKLDIQLTKQHSKTKCSSDRFGCLSDDDEAPYMWVDDGCRGDFLCNGAPVSCSSWRYSYKECRCPVLNCPSNSNYGWLDIADQETCNIYKNAFNGRGCEETQIKYYTCPQTCGGCPDPPTTTTTSSTTTTGTTTTTVTATSTTTTTMTTQTLTTTSATTETRTETSATSSTSTLTTVTMTGSRTTITDTTMTLTTATTSTETETTMTMTTSTTTVTSTETTTTTATTTETMTTTSTKTTATSTTTT